MENPCFELQRTPYFCYSFNTKYATYSALSYLYVHTYAHHILFLIIPPLLTSNEKQIDYALKNTHKTEPLIQLNYAV